MHIGVAVGARITALCGPSYWPGFQDYASERVRVLRKPFPCSPCLRRPTCVHTPEMEAYACMLALTPDEVLVEIDSLMGITTVALAGPGNPTLRAPDPSVLIELEPGSGQARR
jgi:hypothetical protein